MHARLTAQLTLAYTKDSTVPWKRTLRSLVYLQILGLSWLRFIAQTHMHVDVKKLHYIVPVTNVVNFNIMIFILMTLLHLYKIIYPYFHMHSHFSGICDNFKGPKACYAYRLVFRKGAPSEQDTVDVLVTQLADKRLKRNGTR